MRFASAVIVLALSAPASAQVVQPDGRTMPQDSMNDETQLYTLFSSRGEAIDFVADGAAVPDTFSPLCDFTAEFVLNEAGSRFGVGWYDADPSDPTPPDPSEIHVIVPAGAPVGTV